MYKDELKIARTAAKLAGDYLINNKSKLDETIYSSNKDIKLKADIEAESIIKKTISSQSDLPILAEESFGSEEELGETYWVVDPLDGTANYSRNIPICCVSIAIISKNIPVLGVVYDINNKDIYQGSVDKQASLNDKFISVSSIDSEAEGILITGLPNDTDYSGTAMKNMIKNFQSWRKVRMIGSAAMASAYIASGKADAYSETKTYLWDVAAGAALVNAAGGKAVIKNQNEKFQVDVLFTNSSLST